MSVLRIPVRSRLSTLVDQPGGVSVGVALARAKANQAGLLDQARQVIGSAINDLLAMTPPAPDAQTEALGRVYKTCNALIDAAGPFDMAELCQAAAGLCDLIDGHKSGVFDWRIVETHAQSLRLLNTLPPEQAEARATIAEHLRAVVERKLGAPEA